LTRFALIEIPLMVVVFVRTIQGDAFAFKAFVDAGFTQRKPT